MAISYLSLARQFSTADAERPEMTYRAGELTLRFVDWSGQTITLRFPDASAFRWQDESPLPEGVRDDTAYEVIESTWIEELRSLNAAPDEPHHYLLCFNAAGVLEVVSRQLVLEG